VDLSQISARIRFEAILSKDLDLDVTSKAALAREFNLAFDDGTGEDEVDLVWFDSISLAAGADTDIDLSGSLTDPWGDSVSFAKIRGLFIKNASTTDAEIQFGGGDGGDGTNAWDTWITSTAADGSEAVKVPPGWTWGAAHTGTGGYAVTANTGDILRIKNNDGALAAIVEVVILGISA